MMGIDEFLNTKLSGCLFALLMLFGWAYLWYNMGHVKGYKEGLKDNPKRVESSHYVQADGRILRFMEGQPPVIIDLKKNTVTTVFPAKESELKEGSNGKD